MLVRIMLEYLYEEWLVFIIIFALCTGKTSSFFISIMNNTAFLAVKMAFNTFPFMNLSLALMP